MIFKPLIKPMHDAGVLGPNESAVSLHPYRPMRELRNKQFLRILGTLGNLARAMLYLVSCSLSRFLKSD